MATRVSNTSWNCVDASFDLDDMLTLPWNLDHQVAASKELVADMPTVVTDDHRVCVVCMEGFQSDVGGKQALCGHIYHPACISSWLSHSDSCPLCRYNISGQQSPQVQLFVANF